MPQFTALLRTDISAFYDSVSHEDLATTIASELTIAPDTELMKFFRTLLRIPIISYSHLTGKSDGPKIMHQGLAIGNNTEGVLANLYLKSIDAAMDSQRNIRFGRYVDDMRIFATTREEAKRAMLILQEHLLKKGLNLNSSKTEIAEGTPRIEELRSKAYEAYEYFAEEEEPVESAHLPVSDQPFEDFSRSFELNESLKKDKDAKDFCHFLGRVLPLTDRMPAHVDMLKVILTKWHGSGKYAAWRLVETIISSDCPRETRTHAISTLLACLSESNTSTYAKYRLLHYLVRRRKRPNSSEVFRFIDQIGESAKKHIKRLLPGFLEEQAFELNMITLYAMHVVGTSYEEMEAAVREKSPKPIAVPIKNVLILFAKGASSLMGSDVGDISEDEGEEEYH
jgi:hypothetical protein